jgi:hypothetical protein
VPGDYATGITGSSYAIVVAIFSKTLNGREFSKTIDARCTGGVTYERLRTPMRATELI